MRHVIVAGTKSKAAYLALLAGLAVSITSDSGPAEPCHSDEVLLGSRVEIQGDTVYQVDTCMKVIGPWTRDELDLLNGVLVSLPDTPAKRWLIGHVALVRRHAPGFSPIWAARVGNNAALIVNDQFISSTSDKVRQSLLAIESGKAFFARYELERWDARHMNNYRDSMMDMVHAGKAPNEPNDDLLDSSTQFAGVFRALMLQIPSKPEWLAPLREVGKLVERYASPDLTP